MAFDPDKHHRRSIRLRGWDYSHAAAYFVTVVTDSRAEIFGHIVDDVMQLNEYGQIATEEWITTNRLRDYVQLDAFIVMPNHFHGILIIMEVGGMPDVGARRALPLPGEDGNPAQFGKPTARSLSSIVGSYKSSVTKRINRLRNTPGATVWQRSFHDRIIRNDRELRARRQYVANNPLAWTLDTENPANN